MNKYYFLNYWIYDWYSKRDPQPVLYAVIFPAIFVLVNLLCIACICSLLFHFSIHITPVQYLAATALVIVFNYFLLYYNHRYQRLFEQFQEEEVTRRYKKWIFRYWMGTIGLLLLTWIVA